MSMTTTNGQYPQNRQARPTNLTTVAETRDSRSGQGRAYSGYSGYSAAVHPTLPHSIQAEQAFLGSLLVGGRRGEEACSQAPELLSREDFYNAAHAELYAAILELSQTGAVPDFVMLRDEMEKRERLSEIGGEGYLLALLDSMPTAANLAHYAGILREKATLRRLIEGAAQIAGMAYAAESPAADIAARAEQIVFAANSSATANAQRGGWKKAGQVVDDYLTDLIDRYNDGGGIVGIPSGLVRIDSIHTGFKPTDLIIIAARPSVGKTAAVGTIALNAAKAGHIVGIFSQEMSNDGLMERLIAQEAMVDSRRMQLGKLTREELERITEAAKKIRELPLYLEDIRGLSPGEMASRARRLRSKAGGLDLFINDYLQLGSDDDPRLGGDATRIRISNIAEAMKGIAKDLRVPNITISSVSRACEKRDDKRPILSDLAESGAIEFHADVVVFLYRASRYAPPDENPHNPEEPDIMEWIVAKQRKGPTGTVKVGYMERYTKLVTLEEDREA